MQNYKVSFKPIENFFLVSQKCLSPIVCWNSTIRVGAACSWTLWGGEYLRELYPFVKDYAGSQEALISTLSGGCAFKIRGKKPLTDCLTLNWDKGVGFLQQTSVSVTSALFWKPSKRMLVFSFHWKILRRERINFVGGCKWWHLFRSEVKLSKRSRGLKTKGQNRRENLGKWTHVGNLLPLEIGFVSSEKR
jgi:hypothetical protein